MQERCGNDCRDSKRPCSLRIRRPATYQGKHLSVVYNSAHVNFLQADTYILKQDEEHIPDLVKGEEANDALTIPADATDVPQENVRPWPTHKELPKVGRRNISVIAKTDQVASLETRVKYDKGLVDATGGVLEVGSSSSSSSSSSRYRRSGSSAEQWSTPRPGCTCSPLRLITLFIALPLENTINP